MATNRPVARRSFERNATWVGRVMHALAIERQSKYGERPYTVSQMLSKHCPVVLLALAAHHDADDARVGHPASYRVGYTAAQLAPFVGIAQGTVAAALRDLNRWEWVSRYHSPEGYRYVLHVLSTERGAS